MAKNPQRSDGTADSTALDTSEVSVLSTSEVIALTTNQVIALTTAQVNGLTNDQIVAVKAQELPAVENNEAFSARSVIVEIENLALDCQKAADHRGHAALNSLHLALLAVKTTANNSLVHLEGEAAALVKAISESL